MRSARPGLEILEDRLVPTQTPGLQPLLADIHLGIQQALQMTTFTPERDAILDTVQDKLQTIAALISSADDTSPVGAQLPDTQNILASLQTELDAVQEQTVTDRQLLAPSASGFIGEHTSMTIGGKAASVCSGWERRGLVVIDGLLRTIGDTNDAYRGTTTSPLSSDHEIIRFTAPVNDVKAIRVQNLDSTQALTMVAYVEGPWGTSAMTMPESGVLPWDGRAITKISLVNHVSSPTTGKGYGFAGVEIDVQKKQTVNVLQGTARSEVLSSVNGISVAVQRIMDAIRSVDALEHSVLERALAVTDLEQLLEQTTKRQETVNAIAGFTGNARVRDHEKIALGGIETEVSTGWGRMGLVIQNGMLLTYGDSAGRAGTDAAPLAGDHMILRFNTPVTGIRALRMVGLDPSSPPNTSVIIETPSGSGQMGVPSDGRIPWDGSPICSISILSREQNGRIAPYAFAGIEFQKTETVEELALTGADRAVAQTNLVEARRLLRVAQAAQEDAQLRAQLPSLLGDDLARAQSRLRLLGEILQTDARRSELLGTQAALAQTRDVLVSESTVVTPNPAAFIPEHASIPIGGLSAVALTGWQRSGLTVKDGLLETVGSMSAGLGNVNAPAANDHIILLFPSPVEGASEIRIKILDPAQGFSMFVRIDGPWGWQNIDIPADGVVPWDGRAISQLSFVNRAVNDAYGRYGFAGLTLSHSKTETVPVLQGQERADKQARVQLLGQLLRDSGWDEENEGLQLTIDDAVHGQERTTALTTQRIASTIAELRTLSAAPSVINIADEQRWIEAVTMVHDRAQDALQRSDAVLDTRTALGLVHSLADRCTLLAQARQLLSMIPTSVLPASIGAPLTRLAEHISIRESTLLALCAQIGVVDTSTERSTLSTDRLAILLSDLSGAITADPGGLQAGRLLASGQGINQVFSQAVDARETVHPLRLSVVEARGMNVIVAISSPGSSSTVSLSSNGPLSSATLSHPGGTDFQAVVLTMNPHQGSGDVILRIQCSDGSSDAVRLYWDQSSRSLSLGPGAVNPTFTLRDGSSPANSALVKGLRAASALGSQEVNVQLRGSFRSDLVSAAASLPGGSELTFDMDEKIFAAHPEYRPENWTTAIQALWESSGRDGPLGRTQDAFHANRKDFFARMTQGRDQFTEAVGTLLQSAVEMLLSLRRGDFYDDVLPSIQRLMPYWQSRPGLWELSRIGVALPSAETILNCAKHIVQDKWDILLSQQQQSQEFMEWAAAQRDRGMRQDAEGKWLAVTPSSSQLPNGFTDAQIQQTTDLLTAMLKDPVTYGGYSYGELTAMAAHVVARGQLLALATPFASTVVPTDAVGIAGILNKDVQSDDAAVRARIAKILQGTLLASTGDVEQFTSRNPRIHAALNEVSKDLGHPADVQADTAMGMIYIGLYQKLLPHAAYMAEPRSAGQLGIAFDPNINSYAAAAEEVAALTGIPAYKILHAANLNQCFSSLDAAKQALASSLRDLFTQGGYTRMFGPSRNLMVDEVMETRVDIPQMKGEYTDASNHIRVRFDYHTDNLEYVQGNCYLVNVNTGEQYQLPLTSGFKDTLYVDIPMGKLQEMFAPNGIEGQFRIRLGLEPKGGGVGIQGGMLNSEVFVLRLSGIKDLSALPPGKEHDDENMLFWKLSFPVESGGWSYDIASNHHKGAGLYALDLNATNDKGKPVSVAADGVLEDVDLSQGMIRIRVTLSDGASYLMTYYHMTHILEDVTGITYLGAEEATHVPGADGAAEAVKRAQAESSIKALITQHKELKQHDHLGAVGSEGDSTGPHLHFSVCEANGTAVNIFPWANDRQENFPISGAVGGKVLDMHWNRDVRALVNDDNRIVMQRVDVMDAAGKVVVGAENLAYAWESGKSVDQMERVKWVEDAQLKISGWFKVDSNGDRIATVVDGRRYYAQWQVTNGIGDWHSILAE